MATSYRYPVCTKRDVLAEKVSRTSAVLNELVRLLRENASKASKGEYDELLTAAQVARDAADDARRDLDLHQQEHGC